MRTRFWILDARAERLRRAKRCLERVVEEHAPAFLLKEVAELREEGLHARSLASLERLLGADPVDLRVLHQLAEVHARVGQRLLLLLVVEEIHLVDDEEHLVSALLEEALLHEASLALLQDLPRIQEKEDRVRAGNVAVGDLRPGLVQVVHAGGVDQHDAVFEEGRRIAYHQVLHPFGEGAASHLELGERVEGHDPLPTVLPDGLGVLRRPVLDAVNHGRGRRDAGGEDRRAEQRVHEGRLAVVELAQDDEVEALFFEARDPVVAKAPR